MATRALLVSGAPNQRFKVVYRSRGDDDTEVFLDSELDSSGSARIDLPIAYFVLLPEGAPNIPLDLVSEPDLQQVTISD